MRKEFNWTFLVLLLTLNSLSAQIKLRVQGNGLFSSPASTNVDIKSTDDNTNSLLRFGDNNTSKTSLGFNGNEDAFKISMGNTLASDDFTISENGRIGINSLPTASRLFINHNSTSGSTGAAHLVLQENSTGDFARLRFQNINDDALWAIAARATDGQSKLNFFYNDGLNFANLLSLDGDLFRVGIHQTSPDAYLHIKQQNAGVDCLKFENDDQTGGEIWGWRVGDNDILIYFEGGLRGSFNSDDGVYTNFPPPAAFAQQSKSKEQVLDQVLQLKPVMISNAKSKRKRISLNPAEVEKVNPAWAVRSEDGEHVGINYEQFVAIAIKSIQEQQEIIDRQAEELTILKAERAAFDQRLAQIEQQLASKTPATQNLPGESATPIESTTPATQSRLEQNTPNPFRQETLISFSTPESARNVQVQLSNREGKMMRKFNLSNGQNQLKIKTEGLESGTYYYSLIVDGELIETRQMVVQK